MPIFTALGAAIFGAGTFLASTTAFALSAATSIGLSYAIRALSGQTQQQEPAAARGVGGVQGTLQAAGDIPRSFPLGYSVTSGSLVYANTWGNDGDTPNAFLTQVIALSDLPLAGTPLFTYVNGEQVTPLTGENHPDRGWPIQEYRKDGKDHLWVKFYDGTQTTADSFLNNSVASDERPWGVTRIGKGIGYAIVTALVNDSLFTSFPQFRFALHGTKLYDISKDTTAGGSGSQRWSDPTTWGGDGDDLPAVQLYNILRGITFNGEWLYGLQNATQAMLPDVSWINAVNACRSTVTGESGPEAQYRAGHECKVDTQVADTVELLLTACQGRLSEIGGLYKINVGEPGAPVASFSDDVIISSEEQTFTPFFELAKTVTGVSATYPEPAEGWQTKDAPPLRDADLEADAGNRRLLADLRFDCVPYASQVQRLMKSALREAQRARRHTFVLPPEFWVIEPGDIVEWTSERNGYVAKLFRVDGIVDKDNLDVMVDVTEVDPTDYDYDFDAEFNPVTRSPVAFQRPGAQAIADWFAEGATIYDANGFARRPAILLQWGSGVVDDIAGVAFEVRDSDAVVVHRGRTDIVDAGEILISQNLLPNADYEVRGRYLPANPRDTLWSDWLAVTTPNVLISERDIVQKLLYQLTELENQFDDRILELENAFAQVGNRVAATWTDKQVVKREVQSNTGRALARADEAFTLATNTEEAFAEYQLTVAAEFATVSANITVNATAIANLNTAFSSYTVTVNAQLGSLNATVTTNSNAIATLNGYAAARYSVTLDVNGYASGFTLLNGGGGFSTFTVLSAQFQVAFPGQAGGTAVPVFTIGSVNGSAKLGLRGDMLIDGTILARTIGAGEVTADKIQANSIATNQLAIGGVDIANLIAGAATKITSAGISGVTLSFGTESTIASVSFTAPAACTAMVIGSVHFNSFTDAQTFGSTSYGCATDDWTKIRVYVDGSMVHEDRYDTPAFRITTTGVNVRLPLSATAPISTAVSLTAGSHTIEIRAVAQVFSGFISSIAGPTFTSGGIAVFESRR